MEFLQISSLIFLQFIPAIFLLSFYTFTLISSIKQEPNIEKTSFLLVFSIINIVYEVVYIILIFLNITISLLESFIETIIVGSVQISALILFLVYAVVNKRKFGVYLVIAVISILVGLIIDTIFRGLNAFLFVGTSLAVQMIALILNIGFIIESIFYGVGTILLIIHGFKNEDIYLIIAGFIRVGLIGYLIIAPVVLTFFAYMSPSPF